VGQGNLDQSHSRKTLEDHVVPSTVQKCTLWEGFLTQGHIFWNKIKPMRVNDVTTAYYLKEGKKETMTKVNIRAKTFLHIDGIFNRMIRV